MNLLFAQCNGYYSPPRYQDTALENLTNQGSCVFTALQMK